MDARKYLDETKALWGLQTDEELAVKLKTKKSNIDSWVKRNSVPSKWKLIIGQNAPANNLNSHERSNFVQIPKLSLRAAAGGGNHLENIDSFETIDEILIDRKLFKTDPKDLKVIQVDGYSMIPTLLPDSWVVFEEIKEFKGDGLYILNYQNTLMVKILQLNPNGCFEIISSNKEYKSYTVCEDDQSVFMIVGKVVRTVM